MRVGKSVINDDSKAFPGASSIAEITKEVENARGGQNSLGIRLDTVDTNLTKKANKSDIDSINSRLQSTETTLKNKANITDMSNGLASKADKNTTLAQLSKLNDDIGDIPPILNSTVKSAGFEVLELEWSEGVVDSATGNVGKSKTMLLRISYLFLFLEMTLYTLHLKTAVNYIFISMMRTKTIQAF